MNPVFSIIIATYQRKSVVELTIRNVLEQTFTDFELVLVDDGSTDGTAEHLNRVFSNETRIKVIRQENKERGAARNTGIRHANGEYLVFMDSDDRIDRDHLSVLHYHLVEQNFPDFLSTKFDIVRNGVNHPTAIGKLTEGYHDYRILLEGNILGMYLCARRTHPGLIHFEEDRRFSILEDWMFNFSNLRNQYIYLIDRTTYHIVDHENRSMKADLSLVARRMENATDWILENIPLSDEEQRTVAGYSAYFSAVNSFAANDRTSAVSYLKKAIRTTGWRFAYLRLIIKLMLGNRIIKKMEDRP